MHTVSYVDLPDAPASAVFAGAGMAAGMVAGAGDVAVAGAGALAGAAGSTTTLATGAIRLATASGVIDGSPLSDRDP
jgi:hypothetical protein